MTATGCPNAFVFFVSLHQEHVLHISLHSQSHLPNHDRLHKLDNGGSAFSQSRLGPTSSPPVGKSVGQMKGWWHTYSGIFVGQQTW